LRVAAEINALPQGVHGINVLLPQAIDRFQNDVTLQASDRTQRELKKRGIKFEFQDHEIALSIYFRDPDGHQLEITTYEVG
jgi:catechol 2,3-dioxygenase-like lactoylglutathione lyase family enzyme